MKKGLKISKKMIIGIREYMDVYLNVPYTWNGKLTHNKLIEYLYENNKSVPKRGIFSEIKKEDYLRGDYYLVKDEVGQVIPYFAYNLSFDLILSELRKDEKFTEIRREKILNEQGLKSGKYEGTLRIGEVDLDSYDEETYDSLGSLLQKNNRVKRLVRRNYKR